MTSKSQLQWKSSTEAQTGKVEVVAVVSRTPRNLNPNGKEQTGQITTPTSQGLV